MGQNIEENRMRSKYTLEQVKKKGETKLWSKTGGTLPSIKPKRAGL